MGSNPPPDLSYVDAYMKELCKWLDVSQAQLVSLFVQRMIDSQKVKKRHCLRKLRLRFKKKMDNPDDVVLDVDEIKRDIGKNNLLTFE